MNIGFIGIGHMGGAILKGFLNSRRMNQHHLYICGRDCDKTEKLAAELNVTAKKSVEDLVESSDLFFIGVKPKDFDSVLLEIGNAMNNSKVCVSMAAGITIQQMEDVLGSDKKILRIMPNIPAEVGEMMTSVSRNCNVTDSETQTLIKMFEVMGRAEEVKESLIHAVIGVSGSSPAYTFMYIDALAKAAQKNGISEKKARVFASQAVIGAAKLAMKSEQPLEILVQQVCSPGGTTIEAVKSLQDDRFEEIIEKAFQTAVCRSKEMSKGE